MARRRLDLQRGFSHLRKFTVVRQTASRATKFEQTAMQVVHRRATGTLVQVVDVLRDDADLGVVLPGRDGAVPVIGFDPADQIVPPEIPAPDPLGIALPALNAGQLVGIELGPQPVLVVAERRYAALRGDSRTG